jgi:hypothetical protein
MVPITIHAAARRSVINNSPMAARGGLMAFSTGDGVYRGPLQP